MQPEDFKADDLFGQIEALVAALSIEREAREQAEAADRAKSELLALVSHELRTPLGAVTSMAELLLSGPLEPTQRRYAETLAQSTRSLLNVLNDILDYTKLEAGRFEIAAAPFDLHDLIKSAGNALAARAEEKGLHHSCHIGTGVPRYIEADASRIRQVLANLIDNAVKFTSRGSVNLHVNAGETDGKLNLRFDVIDTGLGLNEEQRERLFLPYVQVNSTIASQYGGTGLGLSIARRLVELMGGEIGCESAPGQGSLFWFTIPAKRAPRTAMTDLEPTGRLNGHVLVVEDNAVNRMLVAAYLDEFGLTHDMAEDGAEALARLAARSYDLVLMDVVMPGVDGVEATKRIRAMREDIAEIPIVALTAHAMKGDREEYLAAGMDSYISKPIRGRDLFAALAPYLSADKGEESPRVA
jgi:CheY-like chemotaxis protein